MIKFGTPSLVCKSLLLLIGVSAGISATQLANADNYPVDNELNYLGLSGLFTVPSGSVLDYGEFHFTYTNMVDHHYRQAQVQPGQSTFDGNAFSFALSPFPGLEIGMSNMGYDLNGSSDLIANLKYSPTFVPDHWFDLAVGAVDLGGETGAQRALYGSISKQLGQFRFTVGAGSQRQEQTLRRYEGGFAGIEYQPYKWLTAVAEHDGANTHYGVKFRTPSDWLGGDAQIYGSALVETDIDDGTDDSYFSMGIRTSLFSSQAKGRDAAKSLKSSIANKLPWLFSDSQSGTNDPSKRAFDFHYRVDGGAVDPVDQLQRALYKQGFEAVYVAREGNRLSIYFENLVFNRNELDALGVAMGLAANLAPRDVQVLDVNLYKQAIPTLRFTVAINDLKAFYKGDAPLPLLKPLPVRDLQIDRPAPIGYWGLSPWLPRLSFAPKINHFIGTELGVLDYSLALRSTLELPLWSGASFYGDYDYQLKETEDFQRGRSFYRWSIPSRWTNFAVKQVIRLPFNVYSSVGFGRFKGDYQEEFNGLFTEALWQSPNGAHMVSFSGGHYSSNVFEGLGRRVAVGSYRYYWDDLDLSIKVEAGRYWKQDRGGKLEFAFNFGDSRAKFYIQDTDHMSVGIGFSVPLGMRKDVRLSAVQIKSSTDFNFSTSTMVNSDSGCNCLVPGRAKLAPYGSDLATNYFNKDRLNVNYIKAQQQRLIDAFIDWTAR
jgi:hypothetical protein